ncbi:unnamed protein product, partial [Polarella glacialis]
KFLTEVVHGIRVAKLYAWELAVFARVAGVRREECNRLCASNLLKMIVREGILITLPVAAYSLIIAVGRANGVLVSNSQALMVLGLLNTLRFPMNLFAMSLASTQDALVACRRIRIFLERTTSSREEISSSVLGSSRAVVEMNDAEFAWSADDTTFRLHVDQLRFEAGSKVAIVGRVAAGKTSLLAAMLGEMVRITGRSKLRGRVAYLGQTPWIQNASLRDNILFGLSMDSHRYQQALEAAALELDLETLQAGDLTDIGERGINLSGGQKARVALARCLYAAACGACRALSGIMRLTEGCLLICTVSSHLHFLQNFDATVSIANGRVEINNNNNTNSIGKYLPEFSEVAAEVANNRNNNNNNNSNNRKSEQSPGKKLMKQDKSEASKGSLWLVLGKYLGGPSRPRAGLGLGFMVVLVFLSGQGCRVAADITLTEWAQGARDHEVPLALAASLVVALALRVLVCAGLGLRASLLLHDAMLWRLLRAPVPSFFDVTTCGEILNKFSKDLEASDVQLQESVVQFGSNGSQLLTIFALTVIAIPWFIIILVLLTGVFLYIARTFGRMSRSLQRLDGASRSPIYSSFSETLSGIETIRAWGVQKIFLEGHMALMRNNLRFFHTCQMSESWVMLRLEMLTVAVIGSFALGAVALRGAVDETLVGLALVYAIQMTAMFQRTTALSIQIGQLLTACERVLSFESVEQEPPLYLESDRALPPDWPQGALSFENVSMRYRDGDLVLKGLTFQIPSGSRLGICGRTGAGKSSLITLLFRVVEPCTGRICVDGVDIASLGLHTLRQNLAIIPQDPVIFSGSLRSNLDPFGQASKDEPTTTTTATATTTTTSTTTTDDKMTR